MATMLIRQPPVNAKARITGVLFIATLVWFPSLIEEERLPGISSLPIVVPGEYSQKCYRDFSVFVGISGTLLSIAESTEHWGRDAW